MPQHSIHCRVRSLPQVYRWLSRLTNVEQVLNLWLTVQMKFFNVRAVANDAEAWDDQETGAIDEEAEDAAALADEMSPLEATQDVECDLPFSEIEARWDALMKSVVDEPSVLLKCTSQSMKTQLDMLLIAIEKSEWALSSYISRRRAMSPRLHFLPESDVMQMLANARRPVALVPHLFKCFDSVYTLSFGTDASPQDLRNQNPGRSGARHGDAPDAGDDPAHVSDKAAEDGDSVSDSIHAEPIDAVMAAVATEHDQKPSAFTHTQRHGNKDALSLLARKLSVKNVSATRRLAQSYVRRRTVVSMTEMQVCLCVSCERSVLLHLCPFSACAHMLRSHNPCGCSSAATQVRVACHRKWCVLGGG